MTVFVQIGAIIITFILLLASIGWLGFQTSPPPFPPHPEPTQDLGTIQLPDNLPPPVFRYFQATFGNSIPKIESAVVWGRAKFKLSGLRTLLRFKIYYLPGQFYRYMEITWFGIVIFKASDSYIHGKGVMQVEGLVNLRETGEKIAQGQVLALLGEQAMWCPSMLLAYPHLTWEAIDDRTVRLIVKIKEKLETLLVEFDPQTNRIKQISGMRYRGQEENKTLWQAQGAQPKVLGSIQLFSQAIVSWEDEKNPYWIGNWEGIAYNVDVSEKIPRET